MVGEGRAGSDAGEYRMILVSPGSQLALEKRNKSKQRSQLPTVTLSPPGACKYKVHKLHQRYILYSIVQELCESRGGRPGLSVLTSLLVSVDVKLY